MFTGKQVWLSLFLLSGKLLLNAASAEEVSNRYCNLAEKSPNGQGPLIAESKRYLPEASGLIVCNYPGEPTSIFVAGPYTVRGPVVFYSVAPVIRYRDRIPEDSKLARLAGDFDPELGIWDLCVDTRHCSSVMDGGFVRVTGGSPAQFGSLILAWKLISGLLSEANTGAQDLNEIRQAISLSGVPPKLLYVSVGMTQKAGFQVYFGIETGGTSPSKNEWLIIALLQESEVTIVEASPASSE